MRNLDWLLAAYSEEQKLAEQQDLLERMRGLSTEELIALSGIDPEKLASSPSLGGEDRSWLDRYVGTPLFDQAQQLVSAGLQHELQMMQREQEQVAQNAASNQDYTQHRQFQVQRELLDVQLATLLNSQAAPPPDAGVVAPKMAEFAELGREMADHDFGAVSAKLATEARFRRPFAKEAAPGTSALSAVGKGLFDHGVHGGQLMKGLRSVAPGAAVGAIGGGITGAMTADPNESAIGAGLKGALGGAAVGAAAQGGAKLWGQSSKAMAAAGGMSRADALRGATASAGTRLLNPKGLKTFRAETGGSAASFRNQLNQGRLPGATPALPPTPQGRSVLKGPGRAANSNVGAPPTTSRSTLAGGTPTGTLFGVPAPQVTSPAPKPATPAPASPAPAAAAVPAASAPPAFAAPASVPDARTNLWSGSPFAGERPTLAMGTQGKPLPAFAAPASVPDARTNLWSGSPFAGERPTLAMGAKGKPLPAFAAPPSSPAPGLSARRAEATLGTAAKDSYDLPHPAPAPLGAMPASPARAPAGEPARKTPTMIGSEESSGRYSALSAEDKLRIQNSPLVAQGMPPNVAADLLRGSGWTGGALPKVASLFAPRA